MAYSTIIGILLLASGGIAFAFGLYATNGILKTMINKLLIIICSAIIVWTLGLAIIVAANNSNISMIGHLIAPIGWGPMSSLLLHFTLLLSKKERLLKKWWIYPLLYLPGIMMIYAFTILPLFGQNADDFIHTTYGWVPVGSIEGWDYFFYIYYIGFTIVNLTILVLTRIKSKDVNQKKIVTLLSISYVVAYALGTLWDVVFVNLNILIPRFSPVFSLLPIGALSYAVNKYGALNLETVKQSEISITDDEHSNVYRILGNGFILGSIINIIIQNVVYRESGISNINQFILTLILVAVLFQMNKRFRIKGKNKDMLVAIIFSFIIPYITLRYVQYGANTIWAFIFLLIIICVLYNRRILLIIIIISSIRTQILIWVITPAVLVEVSMADYLLRICFIVISAILSIYVNNIYVKKLKQNTSYVERQILLSQITRDFISAEEWNKDEILYNILDTCGNFIKSERAYIALFEKDTKKIRYSCEWLRKGIQSQLRDFENINSDMHKMILRQFESEKVARISDVKLLHPMAGKFKKHLAEQNIRALVNLPIKEKDEIVGFMGFNSSRPLKEWRLESIEFIEIIANIISDMLIKIETEKKNKFFAYHDQLTHLPNRVLFKDKLEHAIKQANITGEMIGVVFIDIDSFKTVNDTMGHDLGDKLLTEISYMLSSNISSYDAVSRFGGDEFAIMLNHLSNKQDVINIMEKLMGVIRKPINLKCQEFFVTVSAGIALYPEDGRDSETLIKNADIAMYNAKGLGKNRYLMCSKEMKDKILEKMRLTNNLYRALEKEQLMIYYQPQINIDTNTIVGLEALLRWNFPGKGILYPDSFIPLAEQAGLINPIGDWVLENACRQNKLWQDMGFKDLRIAVNISVYQLNNPNFVQQVDDILKKTNLAPEYLELEVTESAIINNEDVIVDVLLRLKKLGVIISIDDFGTEYSSLSRLKILPIDRIKMDRQFVLDIDGGEKNKSIAKVIINLAKTMNLKVIAEGVETKLQLDFLNKWKCDEVQGYYYYKPMSAEEIEETLKNNVQFNK